MKYKLTQGKHFKDGNVYKPGDIVSLPYLPTGLKDRFEPVSKSAIRRRKAEEDGPYKPTHKGSGRWVVLDPDGAQVHDGYLNKKEADRVAKEYNLEDEAENAASRTESSDEDEGETE